MAALSPTSTCAAQRPLLRDSSCSRRRGVRAERVNRSLFRKGRKKEELGVHRPRYLSAPEKFQSQLTYLKGTGKQEDHKRQPGGVSSRKGSKCDKCVWSDLGEGMLSGKRTLQMASRSLLSLSSLLLQTNSLDQHPVEICQAPCQLWSWKTGWRTV